jgi:hypothetical protein
MWNCATLAKCAVPFSETAAIGLINLIYRAPARARYESRFRIGTTTERRLKNEDQNQKRPKTNQPRRIKRQENTSRRSRYENQPYRKSNCHHQPNSEKQFSEVP